MSLWPRGVIRLGLDTNPSWDPINSETEWVQESSEIDLRAGMYRRREICSNLVQVNKINIITTERVNTPKDQWATPEDPSTDQEIGALAAKDTIMN